MIVSWSSLENALVFDGPTYIKLIKNFREMEQFEDADDAYYQYRRLTQTNKKWSLSKLGDIFMWVSCGYGVKPHYTIICGVVIILIFSFIYWFGEGIRRLKEIDGDDNRVSFWDALYFSMVTFTTVGYGDWYPVDRYRKFVMIEGLVGWLTLALFLVTLANVMIRP
ncbi:MAG: potassium channel family protein [Methanophagales archaeon]|nr:potassium channel family protein [Methanophagales archaeon]